MATTMKTGPGIPAGEGLGPDSSHLIDGFIRNGSLEPLPEVERALKAARAEIEAVHEKPFIQKEKDRLATEARERMFARIDTSLAKEAKTRLLALDREDGQIQSAARRDDLIRTPGVSRMTRRLCCCSSSLDGEDAPIHVRTE